MTPASATAESSSARSPASSRAASSTRGAVRRRRAARRCAPPPWRRRWTRPTSWHGGGGGRANAPRSGTREYERQRCAGCAAGAAGRLRLGLVAHDRRSAGWPIARGGDAWLSPSPWPCRSATAARCSDEVLARCARPAARPPDGAAGGGLGLHRRVARAGTTPRRRGHRHPARPVLPRRHAQPAGRSVRSGSHVALLTQDAVPADERWLARAARGFERRRRRGARVRPLPSPPRGQPRWSGVSSTSGSARSRPRLERGLPVERAR